MLSKNVTYKAFIAALIFAPLLGTQKNGTAIGARVTEYQIDPIFLKRQSRTDLSRTLSPAQIKEKLMICFDAARWAPSGGNGQPWRFIYSVHGDKHWDRMLNLLKPGNKI